MQQRKFNKYIITIQLLGSVMFAVVSAAYILGLPGDTVFHGELPFRVAIAVFGSLFFVGSVAMLAVAYFERKRL